MSSFAGVRHNAIMRRPMCINKDCPTRPGPGDFDCDRVCNSCGVEQGPNISHDTEYRIFADDEDKNADKRRADNAQTPLEVDEYEATGISRMARFTLTKAEAWKLRIEEGELVKLTRKRAEAGDASAMGMLGRWYALGAKGLPLDRAQAAHLLLCSLVALAL